GLRRDFAPRRGWTWKAPLSQREEEQSGDRRSPDQRRLGHLERHRTARASAKIASVGRSMSTCVAITAAAPTIAPAAAEVAPLVKPCTAGCLRQRMIQGAKSTTMRNGGRNTPIPAIVAPACPATR